MTASHSAAMIGARRTDSAVKRARVIAAIATMNGQGTPITFAAVARHAEVSSWLVYSPGLRELIDDARARQPAAHPTGPAHRDSPGVVTDLALARAEIGRLRAERDSQRRQLSLALGARIDNMAKADLLTRLDELARHNAELTANLAREQSDNHTLTGQVTRLEDDLAAARTSLRRVIRAENHTPEPQAP